MWLILLLSWVSCGGPGTDSAVDTIEAGAPQSIGLTPVLAIGVVEGDTLREFDRVVTPFVLPGGDVVVPVGGADLIRVFSRGGELRRSLGGPGSGPGEFRYLIAAWPRGDTIEAVDLRHNRITRFVPGGGVEVIEMRVTIRDWSAAAGPFGEGWAIAGVESGEAGRRDEVVARRVARDGTDLGEIARVRGMARYHADRFTGPEPLSPTSSVVVSHDRVYIGETLTPLLRVFAAAAAMPMEIRWTAPPGLEAREALRMVTDSAVAMAAPDRAAAVRSGIEAAPVPERLPVFRRVIVDEPGFIWIRSYDPMAHSFALGGRTGPGGRWLVLTPDGREAGWIDVPPEVEPFQITADEVVGIARDELGVESVRVYALRRR